MLEGTIPALASACWMSDIVQKILLTTIDVSRKVTYVNIFKCLLSSPHIPCLHLTHSGEITHSITIQPLKQINRLLEKICNFLLWRVTRIAARLERTNACTMLTPLMAPKALIITIDINPIRIHICQQVRLPKALQDRSDVGVCPRSITRTVERPIAVIGPEAVDGPVVGGASRRTGVPELRLEQLATRRVETAEVGVGGCVNA